MQLATDDNAFVAGRSSRPFGCRANGKGRWVSLTKREGATVIDPSPKGVFFLAVYLGFCCFTFRFLERDIGCLRDGLLAP